MSYSKETTQPNPLANNLHRTDAPWALGCLVCLALIARQKIPWKKPDKCAFGLDVQPLPWKSSTIGFVCSRYRGVRLKNWWCAPTWTLELWSRKGIYTRLFSYLVLKLTIPTLHFVEGCIKLTQGTATTPVGAKLMLWPAEAMAACALPNLEILAQRWRIQIVCHNSFSVLA